MATLLNIISDCLQVFAYILGMHAISKTKLNVTRYVPAALISTLIVYVLRALDIVPFGVHTLISMLVINFMCVLLCGMEVRKSVLSSIIMMLLVLAGELVDFGILAIFYPMGQIKEVFNSDPVIQAVGSYPGNVLLIAGSAVAYRLRMRKNS